MATDSTDVDIAIIGMAATFAGAPDVDTYWGNILAKRDMVVDAADSWAVPYFDPDSTDNTRIYTRKGGFLGDLAVFDPLEFGIMPTAIDGGEPDQYLALKLAKAALVDAGYGERAFNNRTTGVIIGRGTYVNRGYTSLMQHGLVIDQTMQLVRKLRPDLDASALDAVREQFKQQLPPFTAEMSPGLVPNVVTGRIANRLDLMGPNFIVDAACASSLIAIELAMQHLRRGECDMMITGGVHASTPPQIYMIFCQINALSRGRIRPFDRNADGVLLGEGAGLIVLKRLADAEADGDRIYAVIKAIGKSSDGKALGLLAPRIEGEILAVERAYAAARVAPSSVQLLEAHGTGIPLGDQTEIKALTTVFGQRQGGLPTCAIGSVKSMIGHCIPAAGAAGLIKMTLALHHRVLPPTLCEEPSTALGIESSPFFVNTEAQPWIGDAHQPRRAAINAFGFGGVNAHAVLEEYRPKARGVAVSRPPHAQWPHELCLLAGASAAELRDRVGEALALLATDVLPLATAVRNIQGGASGAHRLSIVADTVQDLKDKLGQAHKRLAEPEPKPFKLRSGVFYGSTAERGKTLVMMPGEGSQYVGMLREIAVRFPAVASWFDFLDSTVGSSRPARPSQVIFPATANIAPDALAELEAQLYGMELGSESVFIATMALYELVSGMGLRPDAVLGHSTGEYAAMVAAGLLPYAERDDLATYMRDLNRIYQQLSADDKLATGVMMAVGAIDTAAFTAILAGHPDIRIPMDNCPNQRIVFGASEAVARLSGELRAAGAICNVLPFDRAYHTPAFAPAAAAFAEFYRAHAVAGDRIPMFSATELAFYPDDLTAIRRTALDQWVQTVRFREAILHLYDQGYRQFVEVGPSSSLTGFVRDTLRARPHVAVALDSRRQSGLRQLLMSIAQLQASGLDLDARAGEATGARAPAAGKRRPAYQISLTLPRLTLTDVPAMPVPVQRADTLATVALAVAPAAAPPPVSAVPVAMSNTPGAANARSDVLAQHFSLMQQFLKTQESVHEQLLGLAEPAPRQASVAAPAAAALPYPLLGTVLQRSEVELVATRNIDVNFDHFLHHHTLGPCPSRLDHSLLALPVVPFTFSMEIIAEAARALVGAEYQVIGMRDLRGTQWLALDRGTLAIRIQARVVNDPVPDRASVHVAIYDAADTGTKKGIPLFEGKVLVATRQRPIAFEPLSRPAQMNPTRQTAATLYSTGMFHGPMLQGVTAIHGWWETGIEAELTVLPTAPFFAGHPQAVLSTDAGLLDAAGQLVGYWLSEKFGSDFNCFPFLVKAFDIGGPWPASGQRLTCRGQIQFTSTTQLEAAFVIYDAAGQPFAQLLGWTDRYFRIPESFYRVRLDPWHAELSSAAPIPGQNVAVARVEPFADGFLDDGGAIWKRVLAHLVLGREEREQFNALVDGSGRRGEWLLGRIAAKELLRRWARDHHQVDLAPADVTIHNDAEGKPHAVCSALAAAVPDISISHQNGVAIAAIADPGFAVGIDLQHIPDSSAANLVALRFAAREKEILERYAGEDKQRAVTVMWSAKEAAAKSAGQGLFSAMQEWIVQSLDADAGAITVSNGNVTVLVRYTATGQEVVSCCVTQKLPGLIKQASM